MESEGRKKTFKKHEAEIKKKGIKENIEEKKWHKAEGARKGCCLPMAGEGGANPVKRNG